MNLSKAAGDVLVYHVAILLAFWVRYIGHIPAVNLAGYRVVAFWYTVALLVVFALYGLYERGRRPWEETFSSVLAGVLVLFLGEVTISFFARGFSFPRTVLVLSLVIQAAGLSLWRYLAWRWEGRVLGVERVLVVAEPWEGGRLAARLEGTGLYRPVGLLVPTADTTAHGGEGGGATGLDYSSSDAFSSGDTSGGSSSPLPVLGSLPDLDRLLSEPVADLYIVGESVGEEARGRILYGCLLNGYPVMMVPSFYELMLLDCRPSRVDDALVFEIRGLSWPAAWLGLKRVADVLVALLLVLLTLPLMGAIALAVRLTSTGPVLYRQERLTAGGRPFTLLKFRTMIEEAERETGPVLSPPGDARVTPVGRWLRATRLDELPQLFNVLAGHMSLVGPRPERPCFVDGFLAELPEYVYRLHLKAGLTGLAQVEARYSTAFRDKLRYDLLYARRWSPLADLQILLRTLRTFFLKDRSR